MRKTIVKLANAEDGYKFYLGQPLVSDNLVSWRPQTRWDVFKTKLRSLLWWRRPLVQVSAIDIGAGKITLVGLRWSWLRWKWVRS